MCALTYSPNTLEMEQTQTEPGVYNGWGKCRNLNKENIFKRSNLQD